MAGEDEDRPWTFTPAQIAIVYLVVSGTWILLSDQLVSAIAANNTMETWLQTSKGLIFILLSAGLIYLLTRRSQEELRASNKRLTRSVQQISVLHRVLRHNLRNACNVIDMNTRLLSEEATDGSDHEARILNQTEALVALSEKARHLRKLLFDEGAERWPLDAVAMVERTVAEFAAEHPAVDVTVDTPAEAQVWSYPQLEVVLGELLTNAVEHAESADVDIGVTVEAEGSEVLLTISDDGPGIPEMERAVLEQGEEDPLTHSQGLGLWVVWTVVNQSGGELAITTADDRGTSVQIVLERAPPATARRASVPGGAPDVGAL